MPIKVKSFLANSPEELEADVNEFIERIGGHNVDSVQFITPFSAALGCSHFAAYVTYYGVAEE